MQERQGNRVSIASLGSTSMAKLLLVVCLSVVGMWQLPSASAEESPAASAVAAPAPGYIENRYCWGCHKTQKQAFLDSDHGRAFSADPMMGCQSCHGGGAEHKTLVGNLEYKGPLKIESFKRERSSENPGERSSKCLACHWKDTRRANWLGSAHQNNDMDCNSCHQIHTTKDKVRDKSTQPMVCYTCHKEQRTQANAASHHPINEGKVVCSNCHNPHGSSGPKMLLQATVNETCYACHTEKRGPFLWEHPPASDECISCHQPHGTNNPSMLKTRPPFLCTSCHIAGGHSTTGIRSGYDLGFQIVQGGNPAGSQQFVVGKACLSCHTQIHGSNHPSGARFLR